jgi:hypothetical protein
LDDDDRFEMGAISRGHRKHYRPFSCLFLEINKVSISPATIRTIDI